VPKQQLQGHSKVLSLLIRQCYFTFIQYYIAARVFVVLTSHFQFGQLIRPVFKSYSQSVSAASGAELDKSVMNWSRDYLSLIALRPGTSTVCLQA